MKKPGSTKKEGRQSTSFKETAATPRRASLPWKLTFRAFTIESLSTSNPTLLTQPARLDRGRLLGQGRSQVKQTTRQAIDGSRAYWHSCHQLTSLDVFQFRRHIASDLLDLPVSAESRRSFLRILKNVPDDATFWQTVREADDTTRAAAHSYSLALSELQSKVWNGEFFYERFASRKQARQWVQSAVDCICVLNYMRKFAAMHIAERSQLLQYAWKHGNIEALPAAVQEGLPARWVQEAQYRLSYEQTSGTTAEIRDFARKALKRVGKALTAIGSGRIEELSPADKRRSRYRANTISKAVSGLMNTEDKWDKIFKDRSKAHRQTLQEFSKTRIRDPQVIEEILRRYGEKRKEQPKR